MRNNNRRLPSTMPCPRCRQLISIQSEQCMHCKLKRPRLYTNIPLLTSLVRGYISFVNPIVMVCFGFYIVSIAINFSGQAGLENPLGALSPDNASLIQLGMGGRIPWLQGKWWTLVTAMFLHGGILHIGFNMLWLRGLGAQVEREYGASRFLIIYMTAGLVGSALSTVAGTGYFVGASGAIFGLFGALIYYGWHRGGTFGSAIFRRNLLWAGLLFLFGLVSPNVDNWGHFGGLLGGLVLAAFLRYEERIKQTLWHHLTAITFLALLVVVFSLMLVNFFTYSPA